VCQSWVSTTWANFGAIRLIAALHRQAPAGQEAVLHVDDDQHALVVDCDVACRKGEPGGCEKRRGQSAAQAANHLTTMEMCHGDLRDRASRSGPVDDFMNVRSGKKQARPLALAHLKPRAAHAGGVKPIWVARAHERGRRPASSRCFTKSFWSAGGTWSRRIVAPAGGAHSMRVFYKSL
jgi:hypothetical protein